MLLDAAMLEEQTRVTVQDAFSDIVKNNLSRFEGVCDYRDFETGQGFDKLVSVGMFEHVGEAVLPEYFRQAWLRLRPGGVFLNHGTAASATFHRRGPSFMDKYVFPDGELVPVSVTLRAAESAGFEVRDVESLREHYALTLRQWVRRLESKAGPAVWRLYMSGSAPHSQFGRLNLYQILLSKPDCGESHLPLTREDWYSADTDGHRTPLFRPLEFRIGLGKGSGRLRPSTLAPPRGKRNWSTTAQRMVAQLIAWIRASGVSGIRILIRRSAKQW